MRLKSFTINGGGYKNLDGTYPFDKNNGYIALIGLNGSGKSNLLEAISIVFDGIVNMNGSGIPFDYEIEYELNGHINTRKKGQAKKDGKICKAEELEYPSSVIACYSGEDLRLWHAAFENYHMDYFNEAVKRAYSSPKFLYVNKYCWKIALISLVCSNNAEVKSFLKKTLNISTPIDVELEFAIDDAKKEAFQTHTALSWFNRITHDGLIGINLNTIATTDIFVEGKQVLENEKSKYIFNFLYLLSQPKKNDRNKIDKLINEIKVSVNVEGNKIDFDNLSEGEKKLILIECITKVLGDENSLVLLDEPDAHTHIAMKKDLLKLISEFEGQTIMTTHSPMFLNKRWDGFDENNIFYLHDGKIEDTEPLKHLAELTDNEIDYFEGSFILSSKNILVTEGPYDILYLKHAINVFKDENPTYNRLLTDVAFMHSGGADNALSIYKETLEPVLAKMNKIAFIFDYDKQGFEGKEKVDQEVTSRADTKTTTLFYQENYTNAVLRKPTEKDPDSYMAEDLFHESTYSLVLNKIHVNSHKEIRNITWADVVNKRVNKTTDAIKTYIEENYSNFDKAVLQAFKPILNQLLIIFRLN